MSIPIEEINDLISIIPEEEQPDGGFDTIPTVDRPIEGGDGGRDFNSCWFPGKCISL